MTFTTLMSIVGWVITGAVAGYLASLLLKAERSGCLVKIVIGIAGAFIGGFVMNFILPGGLIPGLGFINQLITATLGAILLLIVLEIILPGKQLGVDDGGGRRRRR
jgi:uncharacterized membrane protein YeaQ/YmgE (transglycosylase-associated protein family)